MSNETSKNNDIKHEPEIKSIKLSEIDYESAIKPIRKVDTESRDYKKLKKAVEKDGQLHPITVRELTEEEKSKTKDAIYGIIDGHHRYQIALENNQESILVEIYVPTEDDKSLTYKDIAMAYRLNETSIKMNSLQKGEVIYKLLEQQKEGKGKTAKGDDVAKIGEEVFGLKKSMTYAALRKYRIQEKMEEVINKPREVNFEELSSSLSKILQNENDTKSKNKEEILKAIDIAQSQLRQLKKHLKKQETPDSSDKADK